MLILKTNSWLISYYFITGKRWGNPDGAPVLCLHGWLDNAGSFDKLAPLLPNDKFDFVAIDLPGHGFSSHYPTGMNYRFSDTFTTIRYVKEFLNWEKFSFMGHSMGGGVCIWYTSIFPEDIDRLISLGTVCIYDQKSVRVYFTHFTLTDTVRKFGTAEKRFCL